MLSLGNLSLHDSTNGFLSDTLYVVYPVSSLLVPVCCITHICLHLLDDIWLGKYYLWGYSVASLLVSIFLFLLSNISLLEMAMWLIVMCWSPFLLIEDTFSSCVVYSFFSSLKLTGRALTKIGIEFTNLEGTRLVTTHKWTCWEAKYTHFSFLVLEKNVL